MARHSPGLFVVAVCVLATWCSPLRSEALPEDAAKAENLVREALFRETLGLNHERQQLLEKAEAAAPDAPAVHWSKGRVRLGEEWVPLDQVPYVASRNPALGEYQQIRDRYPSNAAGQLALAEWCAERGLAEQARAHLLQVLAEDPDHARARREAGYVRYRGTWVLKSDVEKLQKQERARREALAYWRPRLERVRRELLSESIEDQTRAKACLEEASRADAVEAIELVLAYREKPAALAAVAALREITAPVAAVALVRMSVLSREQEVADQAAKALAHRPHYHYVPLLLAGLRTPAEMKVEIGADEVGGQFRLRQTVVHEEHDQHRVRVTGARIRFSATAPRFVLPNWLAAHRDISVLNAQMADYLANENYTANQLNERVIRTLEMSTGASAGKTPYDWWTWWQTQNETIQLNGKPIAVEDYGESYKYYPIENYWHYYELISVYVPPGHMSCFPAGTPVWTLNGLRPIEDVRIGDLVLSQDVESGELAYRPVIGATKRPPTSLVRIEAGQSERIDATGGHLFWVAGEGWVRARQLHSGQLLHTPTGSVAVSSVSEQPEAPAYNLVIDGFHTYFVGNQCLLCHDNTPPVPTAALVPGVSD